MLYNEDWSGQVRQDSSSNMMFADDIVLCSDSMERVGGNVERWKNPLDRRGMKVINKPEYMCE